MRDLKVDTVVMLVERDWNIRHHFDLTTTTTTTTTTC